MSAPDVLTQKEVCKRLAISDETWRRWRKAGRTPEQVALPGRPRWRRADIDALVEPQGQTKVSAFPSVFRRVK